MYLTPRMNRLPFIVRCARIKCVGNTRDEYIGEYMVVLDRAVVSVTQKKNIENYI